MKKIALMAAILTIAVAVLSGCGKTPPPTGQKTIRLGSELEAEFDPDHLAGRWRASAYYEWSVEGGIPDEYGGTLDPEDQAGMAYVINANGTGGLDYGYDFIEPFTWALSGRLFYVTMDGETEECTVDKLTADELKISRYFSGEDKGVEYSIREQTTYTRLK